MKDKDYKKLILIAIAMVLVAFQNWLFVLIFFTVAVIVTIMIGIDFFVTAIAQFILLIIAAVIFNIYIYKKYLPERYKIFH